MTEPTRAPHALYSSSVAGRRGCFHALSIAHSATMNIGVHMEKTSNYQSSQGAKLLICPLHPRAFVWFLV